MRKADRLLILGCSRQKRGDMNLLPAILRYDGPIYRVFRLFQRSYPAFTPEVYILSARFGLISGTQPIPYYDQEITRQRAYELLPTVSKRLSLLLSARAANDVYICAGQKYLQAMGDIVRNKKFALATGSMGKRQSDLKNWLYSIMPSAPSSNRQIGVGRTYKPNICGTEIKQTPEKVMQIAREALSDQRNVSPSYQSWFVEIDNQRVGPKWLISHLTGFPANKFHTEAAVRALTGLGIEVRHI